MNYKNNYSSNFKELIVKNIKWIAWFTAILMIVTGCNNSPSEKVYSNPNDNQLPEKTIDISSLQLSENVFTQPESMNLFSVDSSTRSVSQVLTLKNSSGSNYPINSITISDPSAGFMIKSNRCGSVLVKGKTCSITISFSASSNLYNGDYFTSLDINGSSVQLQGNIDGYVDPSAGTPLIEISLSSPFNPLGASPTRVLTIKNKGDGTAHDVSAQLPSAYSISINRCSSNLKPKSSCSIQVYLKNYRSSSVAPEDLIAVSASDNSAAPISVSINPATSAIVVPVVCGAIDTQGYYVACSFSDFQNMPKDVNNFWNNKKVALGADIDMSTHSNQYLWPFSLGASEIDGRGHKIYNFSYIDPTKDRVGLFSQTFGGLKVKNLVLENFNLVGRRFVGALLGSASGGSGFSGNFDSSLTIENVVVKNSIIQGTKGVGGLVGAFSQALSTDVHINSSSLVDSQVNVNQFYSGYAIGVFYAMPDYPATPDDQGFSISGSTNAIVAGSATSITAFGSVLNSTDTLAP